MKHINIVIINGEEIDMAALSLEEKKKITDELNRRFLEHLGYQREETA